MKYTILLPVFLLFSLLAYSQLQKAPAYPLITHDPYFSIWSFTDDLTAGSTKHWTGAEQQLMGWLNVDNQLFRFMGAGDTTKEAARSKEPSKEKSSGIALAKFKG